MRPVGIAVVVAATCLTQPFALVAQRDSILKGISAVDAHVTLTWDDRITSAGGPTKEQARATLDARLVLELRKLGLVVSSAPPNMLACSIEYYYSPDTGLVSISMAVSLNEWATILRLQSTYWVQTWNRSWGGTVGRENLESGLDVDALRCAEAFGSAWLAANPKR